MSKIIIDNHYREIIKEVSEWMINEYADFSTAKEGCIHLAEMLSHGKWIENSIDNEDALFCESIYYLKCAVNDLICNSDKREELETVKADDLKNLGLYLENLIQEVKRDENI